MNLSTVKNNKGFSLLELLIYMAILSSLLIIIVNLFFMISSNSAKEEAKIEVQQNLQFAVNEITNQMNNYNTDISITTPMNSGDTGNMLKVSIDGENIKYDVSSGIFRKTIGISPAENVTSSDVIVDETNPIFTRIKDTIQVNLKISYNDKGRPSYKYSKEIKTTISIKK
jgi:prepilin-type N-terminal cleavage/methylation domain-containing protein